MKKFLTWLIVCILLTSCVTVTATNRGENFPSFVDETFLKTAKLDKTIDFEKGITTFILSKTEPLTQQSSDSTQYFKTDSLLLVADSAANAAVVEKNLNMMRATNSNYREDYYLGESVYMYSTAYYQTRNVSTYDFPVMKITSITAGLTVRNGTTSTDWYMRVAQTGNAADGSGFKANQVAEYNLYGGSNPRTISPPSSWKEIVMEPTGISTAGANTYCSVSRPGGSSYFYILENHIF